MNYTPLPLARFARFNLVGLAGAGLQLLVFYLLMTWFHVPEVTATPIAVEIVLLHNFFWHERFTWGERGTVSFHRSVVRLCRFHAANGLISFAGNTALTYCLVEELKFPPLPSAIAAIAVCAPVNFLIADRWVYRSTHRNGGFDGTGFKVDREIMRQP